jgi:hypothetical protein
LNETVDKMYYGNHHSNSDGCGTSVFIVLVLLGAGFITCAFIWSLVESNDAQKQAATQIEQVSDTLSHANEKIEKLEIALGEATQDLKDANNKIAQLENVLETEQKDRIALSEENDTLRIWVVNLYQENQELKKSVQEIEVANVDDDLPILAATGKQATDPQGGSATGSILLVTNAFLATLGLAIYGAIAAGLWSKINPKTRILMNVTSEEALTLYHRRLNQLPIIKKLHKDTHRVVTLN